MSTAHLQPDMVKEIVKFYEDNEELNANFPDPQGYTALHLAAMNSGEEMLTLVLRLPSVDVNARNQVQLASDPRMAPPPSTTFARTTPIQM